MAAFITEDEQNKKLALLTGPEVTETICPVCHGRIRKDERPVSLVECACTLKQVKEEVER